MNGWIGWRVWPLLAGWGLDRWWGDPEDWPHPVVCFGRLIAVAEHRWNHGAHRRWKGGALALSLVVGVYGLTWGVLALAGMLHPLVEGVLTTFGVFYGLAGTTLVREVRAVFLAADRSLDDGRRQVARIVGRDTSRLADSEVRIAALETLAENLSDGVIAPLFAYAVGGLPGMMAYKMINTLDSMVGYRNVRYREFGCVAARLDDVANFLPARLTALLMVISVGRFDLLPFVARYGRQHASPNSGYPESALAGILDCRFGGPHVYFGEVVDKPFIGCTEREVTTADMEQAVRVNRRAEGLMMLLVGLSAWLLA